jgi:membrane protein YdbS with pleckstrin-like domain
MVRKSVYGPPVLGREILVSNEEIIVESRPLIWPHLFEPALVVLIGVVLRVVVIYLEPKYLEFELWSIVKWGVLGIAIIGLFSMLLRFLRWRYTIYALTNKRILRRTGVFGRSYLDCSLGKVQNVEVKMSALSRIFRFGTIRIATARTKGDDIEWVDVKDPIGMQRQINESLERFMRRDIQKD